MSLENSLHVLAKIQNKLEKDKIQYLLLTYDPNDPENEVKSSDTLESDDDEILTVHMSANITDHRVLNSFVEALGKLVEEIAGEEDDDEGHDHDDE